MNETAAGSSTNAEFIIFPIPSPQGYSLMIFMVTGLFERSLSKARMNFFSITSLVERHIMQPLITSLHMIWLQAV